MEYPRLEMLKETNSEGLDIYQLWDRTNNCCLCSWVPSCWDEFEGMRKDLKDMGFHLPGM